MAIVEDEIQNGSEGENEIEVVVEEDDGDQDPDSDDEILEMGDWQRKVAEYEHKITLHPFNYDDHIELIQTLWRLSELGQWRTAFERLWEMSVIKVDHWLLWLRTEENISQSEELIANLFYKATCDCYSMSILSRWSSWALSLDEIPKIRAQLDEVLRRGGSDPYSGKVLWDLKIDFEKSQLNETCKEDSGYKEQEDRVLRCLEVVASLPISRNQEAWDLFEDFAKDIREQEYIEKVEQQHKAAVDYLKKIMPYEIRTKTTQCYMANYKVYLEYIDLVKQLSVEEKYAECDSDGLLRLLYDRVTYECLLNPAVFELLVEFAKHTQVTSSRATYWRVLELCTRRCPQKHTFWTLKMQQAEHEEKDFDEVKSIFETALSKGLESYKEAEMLWLNYLEYVRRNTKFSDDDQIERLRRTFRLAWDSLAEAWGDEANDCEIPLYWARIEYKFLNSPKRGKEIFEELFKYGFNKTMSKYWEALIQLESSRSPPLSEFKFRDLLRRALRSVTDYPPAIARLWTDYERDYGKLDTSKECQETCELKIREWRKNYQALKENMTNKNDTDKTNDNKKGKSANKNKKLENKQKGKRKLNGGSDEASDVKRKRDGDQELPVKEKDGGSSGVKRAHTEEETELTENKKQRVEAAGTAQSASTEACTLFVSNLDFKVDEDKLRQELSKYGDIVEMRLRSGVKSFGGSICYCQYKTADSVEEALKHDRTPLDGRPMFLSRYSADKSKATFKYATTMEKNKLFVTGLPYSRCNKECLTEIFEKYGKLKDIRVVTFKDGKPKGLAYVDYEDEDSAARAIAATNGTTVGDRKIEVAISQPPPRAARPTPASRPPAAGMRRTQLSFLPRVLQQASTSKESSTNSHANGTEKRPLSNSDFKKMIASSSSSHDN